MLTVADEVSHRGAEPVGRMEVVIICGEQILVGTDVDASALARASKRYQR